jgi:chromosome segregation ATPase
MAIDVLSLVLLLIALGIGAAGGWTLHRTASSQREADLKRSLFESKGTIPQLEAAVRTRDQRLASQHHEIEGLKKRLATADASLTDKSNEIVKRDREMRRMSAELAIANDAPPQSDLVPLIDGAGEETAAAAATATPETALVQARLKKIEARYETLKNVLIKRDDRIAELEAQLAQPRLPDETQTRATAELDAALANRDAQIKALEARLAAEAEQREVLETLAKGRAAGNKELRENATKLEQQAAALRKSVEMRTATVAERDEQIRVLNEALAESRRESAARAETIATLEHTVAARDGTLATERASAQTLAAAASAKDARIAQLESQLAAARAATTSAEAALRERAAADEARVAKVEAAFARVKEHEAAKATLEKALRDRDFRIDALNQDVERLNAALAAANEAVPPAPSTPVPVEATAEADATRARIATLTQQVEMLERDAALRERRLLENDRERARLAERLAALEAPAATHVQGLEKQLAAARERIQRVEDELLDVAREAKTLRARIAELEAEGAIATDDDGIPLLSNVTASPAPATHPA